MHAINKNRSSPSTQTDRTDENKSIIPVNSTSSSVSGKQSAGREQKSKSRTFIVFGIGIGEKTWIGIIITTCVLSLLTIILLGHLLCFHIFLCKFSLFIWCFSHVLCSLMNIFVAQYVHYTDCSRISTYEFIVRKRQKAKQKAEQKIERDKRPPNHKASLAHLLAWCRCCQVRPSSQIKGIEVLPNQFHADKLEKLSLDVKSSSGRSSDSSFKTSELFPVIQAINRKRSLDPVSMFTSNNGLRKMSIESGISNTGSSMIPIRSKVRRLEKSYSVREDRVERFVPSSSNRIRSAVSVDHEAISYTAASRDAHHQQQHHQLKKDYSSDNNHSPQGNNSNSFDSGNKIDVNDDRTGSEDRESITSSGRLSRLSFHRIISHHPAQFQRQKNFLRQKSQDQILAKQRFFQSLPMYSDNNQFPEDSISLRGWTPV